MKTTQKQVSIRVFKKLSALRATLSNEERDILDNLIGVEEVAAHKIAVGKAVQKNVAKNTEVAAHKIAVGKAVQKNVAKNTAKNTEVAAHKIAVGKAVQ